MNYETILIKEISHGVTITLNRLNDKNSLNKTLMQELHSALDEIEKKPECKIIVIKGQPDFFCTGMDFKEITHSLSDSSHHTPHPDKNSQPYMGLLKRFSEMSKFVITEISGVTMAGGIGLVAASDYAICKTNSQFTLSEALWGLIPANLMPFLIRRVGFQKAYSMTLTTQTLSAAQALDIQLVDEVAEDTSEALRRVLLRMSRIDSNTIHDIKKYFRKMWIIDEKMEQTAIQELERLLGEKRVQNNIKNFITDGVFPWEAS